MDSITIYPHGKIYIFLTAFKYIFMGALGIGFTIFIFPFRWMSLFFICFDILIIAFLIWQTREIFRYKLVIYERKMRIFANRDLFFVRHKDLDIKFSGIKTMQFKLGINLGVGLVSAIVLFYDEKRMKYLNTMWFSRKQVDRIMALIKENADKINEEEVEVLEPDIQGNKKKKNKK